MFRVLMSHYSNVPGVETHNAGRSEGHKSSTLYIFCNVFFIRVQRVNYVTDILSVWFVLAFFCGLSYFCSCSDDRKACAHP